MPGGLSLAGPPSRVFLPPRHAQLGNSIEAGEALGKMLEQGMTPQAIGALVASTDPEIAGRYIDGLRRAGLPRT